MKRLICIVLAVLMIAVCFAGCKKTSSEETANGATKSSMEEVSESKIATLNTETEPASTEKETEPVPETTGAPDPQQSDNQIVGKWYVEYNLTPMVNEALASGKTLGEPCEANLKAALIMTMELTFKNDNTYIMKTNFKEGSVEDFIDEFAELFTKFYCDSREISMDELDAIVQSQGYKDGLSYIKDYVSDRIYKSVVDSAAAELNSDGTYELNGDTLIFKPTIGSNFTQRIRFEGKDTMIMVVKGEDKENAVVKNLFTLTLTRIS